MGLPDGVFVHVPKPDIETVVQACTIAMSNLHYRAAEAGREVGPVHLMALDEAEVDAIEQALVAAGTRRAAQVLREYLHGFLVQKGMR